MNGAALIRLAATLGLGTIGGAIAWLLNIPLPWMTGPLVLVAIVAMRGLTIGGEPLQVPPGLRFFVLPIIGVMLGSSFTPEVTKQMLNWWPTLLSLVVFVPFSALCVSYVFRNVFGFDPATAFFASVPGGLVEMAIVGDGYGGDPRYISFIHFGRLTLAVILIPIALRVFYGPVGSAALSAQDVDTPIELMDFGILAICAIAGFFIARGLKIPGGQIIGPIVFSAVAHATGLTHATPPYLLVQIAQVVIGTSLGSRFGGFSMQQFRKGAGAILAGFTLLISIAMAAAYIASRLGGGDMVVLGLAFAPAGVTEMSLIALSLNLSVAFVTAHHIVRIIFAVLVAPAVFAWLWGAKQ